MKIDKNILKLIHVLVLMSLGPNISKNTESHCYSIHFSIFQDLKNKHSNHVVRYEYETKTTSVLRKDTLRSPGRDISDITK